MFETLKRSFGLVKKSFGVLLDDKKLLLFPAISSILMIALVISFILPIFVFAESDILFYMLVAIFYLAAYFIIIFFNSALIYAASSKMEGKEVSVGESVSFSMSRVGNIFAWALIAATVGMILSILRDKAESGQGPGMLVARFVIGIVGLVWSLATYFVVPILVFENVGPIDAIKKSVSLIKKTWGESVIGGIGISGVFFLFYLVGFGLAIVLFVLGGILPVLVIALPVLLIIFLAQEAIQGIFVAALYKYATTGQSAIFAQEELEAAFRKK